MRKRKLKLGINLQGVYYTKANSRTFMIDHIRILGLFSTTERNVTRRKLYLFAVYLNILPASLLQRRPGSPNSRR